MEATNYRYEFVEPSYRFAISFSHAMLSSMTRLTTLFALLASSFAGFFTFGCGSFFVTVCSLLRAG